MKTLILSLFALAGSLSAQLITSPGIFQGSSGAATISLTIPGGDTLPATCAVGDLYIQGGNLHSCITTNTWAALREPGRGTALPGTCSVGDLFVDTDADAGSNLNICTAPNTWTGVVGGGEGGGLTALGEYLAGTTSEPDVDTSKIPTLARLVSGQDTALVVSGGPTTFTAVPITGTITDYSDGMRLLFRTPSDQTCSGSVTLNVSTRGAKPVYRSDKTTPLTCSPGQEILLSYNLALDGFVELAGGSASSNATPLVMWSAATGGVAHGVATPANIAFPAGSAIYAMRVSVVAPLTIGRFNLYQSGTGAAGCVWGIAIYSADGAIRHTQWNHTCTGAGGSTRTATITPVTLPPGNYIYAWGSNDTTAGLVTGYGLPLAVLQASNNATTRVYCSGLGTYDAVAMPDTLPIGSCATVATFSIPNVIITNN